MCLQKALKQTIPQVSSLGGVSVGSTGDPIEGLLGAFVEVDLCLAFAFDMLLSSFQTLSLQGAITCCVCLLEWFRLTRGWG